MFKATVRFSITAIKNESAYTAATTRLAKKDFEEQTHQYKIHLVS
jgi:hypothetical protein